MSIEYEIRLYEPHSRRPLCFTRTETAGAAHALARRWQHDRPECRVLVVATSAPRPRAMSERVPAAS
jgi:hypothetical protein